jgi:hypothetical protein
MERKTVISRDALRDGSSRLVAMIVTGTFSSRDGGARKRPSVFIAPKPVTAQVTFE